MKSRTSIASKSTTDLTTGYDGWQFDLDVGYAEHVIFGLTMDDVQDATTITLLHYYGIKDPDSETINYFPATRQNSNVLELDELTWTVSADGDQTTHAIDCRGFRYMRLAAKANAVGAADQDTLSAKAISGSAH